MIMILRTTWTLILDMWKLRNQHLHNNVAQLVNLPNYQQVAISLYEQCHQLPPAVQDTLYYQPLKTVLELPALQLQCWVQQGYQYFNQQLKAAKNKQ